MKRIWIFLSLLFTASAAPGSAPATAESASRVVILANAEDPDSLRIARHYGAARGVPEANLVSLRLPGRETISWREFVTSLWNPLLEVLVRERWIDAIPMSATDAIGRRKYAPQGHRIAALVVCRGVPLRIEHDSALYAELLPLTRRAEFRTNAGAVDAELSLLAQPNYPINAFFPNPLFANERPSDAELGQVVKVGRLDGPSAEDAMALVDRAMAAERDGLLGRAYVDLAGRDPVGDEWLESVGKQLPELGFDLTVDRGPATFSAAARMDAPVLYFGWYAGDVSGPFALPGFRFPPGAIALHIHSYSAQTLRSTSSGWAGPFVARGVTATVGNVHEPYLNFTHQPHLLLRALARGATLADAAYYSLRGLSWQAVLIGDPLYRPFARPRGEQPPPHRAEQPSLLAGYAVLDRMRALDAAGRGSEATQIGAAALQDVPNLPLAYEVARRLQRAGDSAAAGRAVGVVSRLERIPTDQWALAAEVARLLVECGLPAKGTDIWNLLFAQPAVPDELRIAWLPDAVKAATIAAERSRAEGWQRELERLTAPPGGK